MAVLDEAQQAAVLAAVTREISGVPWDEIEDKTLSELCAASQDALIDDLYEEHPADDAHRAAMREQVKVYDLLLGTARHGELPAAVTPVLGQEYAAGVLPPGSVVTAGTPTEYVICRTGLCMRWEQPIPESGRWTVTYAGRLAPGEWMTPRERAEVDEVRRKGASGT